MIQSNHLKRTIGLSTTVAIVIGGVIGSGIFMRPAEMAGLLGSPLLVLMVWVLAGIFTLFVSLIFSEMGTMMPETGGTYVFIEKIYGDFCAYLFGWANFVVINTAANVAIAFIFSQYFNYLVPLPRFPEATEQAWVIHLPMIGNIFPLENFGVKMLTVLLLASLSLMAYISTKTAGFFQRILTATKVLAIVMLVGGLFLAGKGDMRNLAQNDPSIEPVGFALLAAIYAAFTGALQAYDGAQIVLFIGGEIKKPERTIPRSMYLGFFIIIGVYLLVNAAIMYVMPVGLMAGSEVVAADASELSFGFIGGGLIAALICLSVLGTDNANVYTTPRMTYAMALRKHFFANAGIVHKKFQTPGNAIIIHFAWMFVLVLSGSFYILADMYIFVVWVFNVLLVYGIFILRKRMPDAPRPYKVWGYPWIPVLVLLFSLSYLGFTLYNDIQNYYAGKAQTINSVFGIILTSIGIPLYWVFKNMKTKKD